MTKSKNAPQTKPQKPERFPKKWFHFLDKKERHNKDLERRSDSVRSKSAPGFTEFARITSVWTGSPVAFGLAAGTIVVWLISGPIFHYSDTWQLVINTGTTIVTFLMVFLIQNSQNRDGKMIQLKLDELIRAQEGAETRLIDMDDMCEDDLEALRVRYLELAQQAGRRLKPEDLKDANEKVAPSSRSQATRGTKPAARGGTTRSASAKA
ncbi:MAG TPA: low affinity iron permease family protein [Asticcacaulis sp.]|jgi:low affinity Fe/Cu permease|nr:low affinity iron permease family protein [Asticcacaulis sp.]